MSNGGLDSRDINLENKEDKMKRIQFPASSIAQKEIRWLSSGSERYTIPEYQRPYSWTVKEVRELINDKGNYFELNDCINR